MPTSKNMHFLRLSVMEDFTATLIRFPAPTSCGVGEETTKNLYF